MNRAECGEYFLFLGLLCLAGVDASPLVDLGRCSVGLAVYLSYPQQVFKFRKVHLVTLAIFAVGWLFDIYFNFSLDK